MTVRLKYTNNRLAECKLQQDTVWEGVGTLQGGGEGALQLMRDESGFRPCTLLLQSGVVWGTRGGIRGGGTMGGVPGVVGVVKAGQIVKQDMVQAWHYCCNQG